MGYPGKNRKSYDRPKTPFQADRIASEVEFVKAYGLRNKKELWKAQAILRKYRHVSRTLLAAMATGERSPDVDAVLNRLKKFGILREDGDLDAILSLKVNDLLERRLQTQVYLQGLANSLRQSRQFIAHGHIQISGRKVTVPGYLVKRGEEMSINYYVSSPMTKEGHPERSVRIMAAPVAAPASPTPKVEG